MKNSKKIRIDAMNNIEMLIRAGDISKAENLIKCNEEKLNDDEIFYLKSKVCIRKKNIAQAKIMVQKGLIFNITNINLLLSLAHLYELEGNLLDAAYFYNKIRLFSLDPQLHKRIGEIVSKIADRYDFLRNNSSGNTVESENTFSILLIRKLIENITNYHIDNADYWRFGEYANRFMVHDNDDRKWICHNLESFCELYNKLNDDYSKNLLVEIIAFRILGNKKIKLFRNNIQYHNDRNTVKQLFDNNDFFQIKFRNRKLYRFNLNSIGYPIEIYNSENSVLAIFLLKQYEYRSSGRLIKAEKGDIVIDAGACYGETALRFAYEVGNTGKVYSFEFMPENLEVFNKNLDLNPELKNRIEVIKHPVHRRTNDIFYPRDYGAGSRLSKEKSSDDDIGVKSLSLDDFAARNDLKRVDFLKMDVEGAELNALLGAESIIKKHKPKLAISVYHYIQDFINIMRYLDSLDLGYKFYLDHYTIHLEETILYGGVE